MKMNGEINTVIPNISLFDAFTVQTTALTNQVVIGGGNSGGVNWQSWIAYPIVLCFAIIAVLIAIRQNFDSASAFVARMQQCVEPIIRFFRSRSGANDENIELEDVVSGQPVASVLHLRNLSDSERIRAGAVSVSI